MRIISVRRILAIVTLPLLALTALAGASRQAMAQNLEPVSVIVFPGGFNWPLWVAQEKGYFAKGGIEVKLTPTPNSVFQLTNLIEGKFDIGVTAIDNVVAYMEGQGEVPVSIQPDLFVFMGGDNGLLSLAVLPEIKTFQDLKGKTLSVDAMTTGYAFVLFDLLKRNGLKMGDYNVVKAGGVLARWEALKERKHDGTMLLTPFDLLAKANGLNILQYAIDVYGQYQGLSGATRRAWAAANPKKLDAYIRGYREGRSTSKASAACWRCAANMASRRRASPIRCAITIPGITRRRSADCRRGDDRSASRRVRADSGGSEPRG